MNMIISFSEFDEVSKTDVNIFVLKSDTYNII